MWCPTRRHNTVIINSGFYYEVQSPTIGRKAYFVVKYLPSKVFSKVFPENTQLGSALHWAQLTNLFVDVKYRRQSYGAQLLALLREWQDSTQTNILFLASPYRRRAGCDRRTLHSFYSDNGFPCWQETLYHYRLYDQKLK